MAVEMWIRHPSQELFCGLMMIAVVHPYFTYMY